MPYVPAAGLAASALTDSAGGTVSRTLDAAGGAYVQSVENKERSSLADAVNALRTILRAGLATRGAGYRPVTPPTFTLTGLSMSSTTIAAGPVAVFDQTNENTYRGNLGQQLVNLIADLTTARGITGPRGSFTLVTDSSGGTPSTSMGQAGTTHNQAGENNARASLAQAINNIANAMGVAA